MPPSDFELNFQREFAKNDVYHFSISAKERPLPAEHVGWKTSARDKLYFAPSRGEVRLERHDLGGSGRSEQNCIGVGGAPPEERLRLLCHMNRESRGRRNTLIIVCLHFACVRAMAITLSATSYQFRNPESITLLHRTAARPLMREAC